MGAGNGGDGGRAGDAGLSGSTDAGTSSAGDASVLDAAACTLTPEQEQGPYYVPLEQIRSDVTGNSAGGGVQPGVPLSLQITLVDSSTCQPVANAAVDIWHCNAEGVYSQFEQNSGDVTFGPTSSTCYEGTDDFLRGVQITSVR